MGEAPPERLKKHSPDSDDSLRGLLEKTGLWRASSIDGDYKQHCSTGFTGLDQELPGAGWPADGVTEFLHDRAGIGELRLLAPALARMTHEQNRWILFVSPPYIPYPPALAQAGIDLTRVIVSQPRTPKDYLWVLEKALASQSCSAVIAWPGRIHEKQIRRLQLASKDGYSWGILFRPRVVYLPSCGSRTLGPAVADRGAVSLPETVTSLLDKAGYQVVLPAGIDGLCCGMAFHSKGQFDEAQRKGRELLAALLDASRDGRDPVLFDTSPCLQHMQEQFAGRLVMYEPVEFTERYVLPRVDLEPVVETVAVHVTCSGRKLGLEERTVALAGACAEHVVVPEHVGCCGFAGDRGFDYPELNASALKHLQAGLDGARTGYSTSRTCEIGLARHGDIPYRSILELVDRAARPRHSVTAVP